MTDRKKRRRSWNPADARLEELAKMAKEEEEWSALCGPVTVRYVEPKKKE